MSQALVVICAVGLTPAHIGTATPTLKALADAGRAEPMAPALPAVTTTAQTTMLTGVDPSQHGIVANGWYFRELGEVWLWRQSEALIQAPLLWNTSQHRVLKHFWWYAMNSSAGTLVTPRPAYHHDGAKSPDFYTSPPSLKDEILDQHGAFPLFKFWGPMAAIDSTRWIADSFDTALASSSADLGLVYLPHLDYDLQRFGPTGPHLEQNLRDLDDCVARVVAAAERRGARVLVVSEYGLETATGSIPINRVLREEGWLAVTTNATGELLDPGPSQAFAVCDHQLAHVYVDSQDRIPEVAERLTRCDGMDRVLWGERRAELGLNHQRSGDIICLAAEGYWFRYEYWLDDRKKPDFAHSVEIHKKPGYDPRELVMDAKGGKWRAARALLRKKLGLRYVMDPIGLDPSVVKGTHGRPPARPEDGPLVIAPDPDVLTGVTHQRDIAGVITRLLNS